MNKVLWSPDSKSFKESKMALFIDYINQKHDLLIEDYQDYHSRIDKKHNY